MSFKFNRLVPVLAVALGAASVANAAQQCFIAGDHTPITYGAVTATASSLCNDNSFAVGSFAPGTSQTVAGRNVCTFSFSKPLLSNSFSVQVDRLIPSGTNLTVRLNGQAYTSAQDDIGPPLVGGGSSAQMVIGGAGYNGATSNNVSGTIKLTNNPPETLTSITVQYGAQPAYIKICADDTGLPPPVLTADSYSTPANAPLSVAAPGVLGNDVSSGGAMKAALVTAPANGTVTLNEDGSFDYTPKSGFSGSDTFTYTATADGNTSAPIAVTISVTAPAPAPAPTAANPVPALGSWGLLALSPILGLVGFFGFSRRRKA